MDFNKPSFNWVCVAVVRRMLWSNGCKKQSRERMMRGNSQAGIIERDSAVQSVLMLSDSQASYIYIYNRVLTTSPSPLLTEKRISLGAAVVVVMYA